MNLKIFTKDILITKLMSCTFEISKIVVSRFKNQREYCSTSLKPVLFGAFVLCFYPLPLSGLEWYIHSKTFTFYKAGMLARVSEQFSFVVINQRGLGTAERQIHYVHSLLLHKKAIIYDIKFV